MLENDGCEAFESFFARVEPRLRQSLCAAVGSQAGREAAVDALAHAWEHWGRVRAMENPAGYLYVVGRIAPVVGSVGRGHPCCFRSTRTGRHGWNPICRLRWRRCRSSSAWW